MLRAPSRACLAALLVLALPAFLVGCPRRIGDGCTTSIECSINADRRCDTAQPSGYCTIPECDPDRCPDEALCVEFYANVPRLARRFCMHSCRTDGDCRGGYTCVQPTYSGGIACPVSDSDAAVSTSCTRALDTQRRPDQPTGYCVAQPVAGLSIPRDS